MAEKEKSFDANPNQKVYDMPHQVDHLVEVFDIYFAEQVKVYKNEPKSEVVKTTKNTTVKAILAPFKKDKKKLNVTSTPSDPKTVVKKGESVTVNWEEKVHAKDENGKLEYDYPKINKIKVGKKLFIVAKCSGDKAKLTIEIFENKLTNAESVYDNPVKFLIGEEEKTKIEFDIKSFQPGHQYEQEITLKPKSKEEFKKLIDKFNKRKDKNAFLYLKADVTDTISDINFVYQNTEFQNAEGNRFEVLGTPCYCNRDIKVDEMISIIYNLRDKGNVKTKREHFFDEGTELISSIGISSGKMTDSSNKDKIKLFTDEFNTMFKKYEINTCKRKIHFVGQICLETINFSKTYESRSTVPDNYKGGVSFQGRGMKQITHDYNYLAYYDYIKFTKLYPIYEKYAKKDVTGNIDESVGECIKNQSKANDMGLNNAFYEDLKTFAKLLSSDLFHSVNSAGWFSVIWKKKVLLAMDKGLSDDNVKSVTKLINGGETNLIERQNYTKWTKEFFNYETDCINK
ncbi:hypothetical protein [Flavobacterium sp.]|uniref:hypothetical protein n=1 Tax=Flavobacterium sp. TaxID=239 RepID=UPI00286CDEA8|nr:hypothetical protein [Flavobacterium sp.]